MSHADHYCNTCHRATQGLSTDEVFDFLTRDLSSGVRAVRATEIRRFAARIGVCGCARPAVSVPRPRVSRPDAPARPVAPRAKVSPPPIPAQAASRAPARPVAPRAKVSPPPIPAQAASHAPARPVAPRAKVSPPPIPAQAGPTPRRIAAPGHRPLARHAPRRRRMPVLHRLGLGALLGSTSAGARPLPAARDETHTARQRDVSSGARRHAAG